MVGLRGEGGGMGTGRRGRVHACQQRSPLCPLPLVFPVPLPCPRPMRFRFLLVPGLSLSMFSVSRGSVENECTAAADGRAAKGAAAWAAAGRAPAEIRREERRLESIVAAFRGSKALRTPSSGDAAYAVAGLVAAAVGSSDEATCSLGLAFY